MEPRENLWVKSEVPGQVVQIIVEEGQIIKRGRSSPSLMTGITAPDWHGSRPITNWAKLDYDRYVTLSKQKITSESEKDRSEARLKDLSAQRNEARRALSRTRITSPIGGRLNELKAEVG